MVRNTRVYKFSERTLQGKEHRFPQVRFEVVCKSKVYYLLLIQQFPYERVYKKL